MYIGEMSNLSIPKKTIGKYPEKVMKEEII
jgi:hypothetical protein